MLGILWYLRWLFCSFVHLCPRECSRDMGRKAISEYVWNSQQLCQHTKLWIMIMTNNNNNDINPDVNGTYLGSFLKYYHQLNDWLYLCEGFNTDIHSLCTWILLLKSFYTYLFSLNKGGLKLYYHSVQRVYLVISRSICSEAAFHSTCSPVIERGKDNPSGTTYCSQSRKRQKLWQWCLESPYHGLKTTLSKGKKKCFFALPVEDKNTTRFLL